MRWIRPLPRRCEVCQGIVVDSTCRRVAAISILPGVHRDRGTSYGEQWSWSRRRKTRRGFHGEETTAIDEEKEIDITIRRRDYAAPRTEKEKNRNGMGNGLRRLGMKGREAVREKRRDGRDIATKSESRDEATTR